MGCDAESLKFQDPKAILSDTACFVEDHKERLILSIQPPNPPKHPAQPQQHINVGRRMLEALRNLMHHRHQCVQLQRPPSFNVLQHAGLEGPELGGDQVAVFGALGDLAPDLVAQGGGFGHGLGAEVAQQRVRQHLVDGGAGDGGDGVHRHVAPQLVPNVVAHAVAVGGVKAGLGHQVDHGLGARAVPALGLADDEALAHLVLHQTRRGRGGAGVHHAAEHVREWDRAAHHAAGVHALQGRVTQAGKALAEPPGDAVHGRHDDRVGRQQRRDALRHLGQRRAFHGDDDQVLRTQGGCGVAGLHGALHQALRGVHPKAMLTQRLQRGPARQGAELGLACSRKLGTDEATDGPCPHDAHGLDANGAHSRLLGC
jgi:hypothetical protein